MAYMHIDNLYKNIEIMTFKECYALEKIHGTSAHISWKDKQVKLFSGGEKHDKFAKLFDVKKLKKLCEELLEYDTCIFGEAYGGKCQGMSETYGKELKFIVFDVRVGEHWLDVINAEDVAKKLGLEFVSYNKIKTDLKSIDAQRDLPSVQAKRNGIEEEKLREGVVLRPMIEVKVNNGKRIMVKHKREEFRETKTKREVNPESLKILEEGRAIAEEWVTPMRLTHVLDKIGNPKETKDIPKVIGAMLEDVFREAENEIVKNKAAKTAICRLTAKFFMKRISKI